MIYFELFLSFFIIGLFSIGGGYAAMPLIQYQVVDLHSWLTMTQFSDIITIAEMTPGPIAINCATFVGIRIAGIFGAIISTVGCVLPSSIIVMSLAYVYYRFRELSIIQKILANLRPAVISMIASAGISLTILTLYGNQYFPPDILNINYISLFIFLISLFILRKWKISPLYVMCCSGILGIFLYTIF